MEEASNNRAASSEAQICAMQEVRCILSILSACYILSACSAICKQCMSSCWAV